jgi:hypothetical protein
MSVLTVPDASSTRVAAVARYLSTRKGRRESRERLHAVLSPPSLRSKEDTERMISNVVNECRGMRLVALEEEDVVLSGSFMEVDDAAFPSALTRFLFSRDVEANHDLGLAIAWYLSQDVLKAPCDWKSAEAALREQTGEGKLGINDARYSQLEDWVCYLGFGWRHKTAKGERLVPDPTFHLRPRMSEVFENQPGRTLSLSRFLERVAEICPVLEGGFLRQRAEEFVPREEGWISPTTAHALLRLHEEKWVELSRRSDAHVVLFPTGHEVLRFSEVTWKSSVEAPR